MIDKFSMELTVEERQLILDKRAKDNKIKFKIRSLNSFSNKEKMRFLIKFLKLQSAFTMKC